MVIFMNEISRKQSMNELGLKFCMVLIPGVLLQRLDWLFQYTVNINLLDVYEYLLVCR